MLKTGMQFEDIPVELDILCPRCGQRLIRVWGNQYDYDMAVCDTRGCDFEGLELDESTGFDIDGTVYQMIREDG